MFSQSTLHTCREIDSGSNKTIRASSLSISEVQLVVKRPNRSSSDQLDFGMSFAGIPKVRNRLWLSKHILQRFFLYYSESSHRQRAARFRAEANCPSFPRRISRAASRAIDSRSFCLGISVDRSAVYGESHFPIAFLMRFMQASVAAAAASPRPNCTTTSPKTL